jgi:hypothetical protein
MTCVDAISEMINECFSQIYVNIWCNLCILRSQFNMFATTIIHLCDLVGSGCQIAHGN